VDRDFWLARWQSGEIGFHRSAVHDFLPRYWPSLDVAPGATVFVPLAGKSLDMVWLAANGHCVVGVELSPLAVEAFFEEHGLAAERQAHGPFVVWSAGPFTIWCGDLFELPGAATQDVTAAYDRAALVAMPPSLQPRYAKTLSSLLPGAVPILLVSLSYPEGQMSGPPFSTPLAQVTSLFGATYALSIAETRDGLEESQNLKARGVTALDETAYVLRRKPG